MSSIRDIVAAYANGQIDFNYARESMRQIRPRAYEPDSEYGPIESHFLGDEGGYMELSGAAMTYDLTANELDLLARSLFNTPIGDNVVDYSEAHTSEAGGPSQGGEGEDGGPAPASGGELPQGPISLEQLLAPDPDESRDFLPESDVPQDTENPPIPGEKDDSDNEKKKSLTKALWRSLFKHASHDQSTHGNWAKGSGKPWTFRDTRLNDVVGVETHDGKRVVFRVKKKSDSWGREALTVEYLQGSGPDFIRYDTWHNTFDATTAELLDRPGRYAKHYPGGQSHEQERHGDWATGATGDSGSQSSGAATDTRESRDRAREDEPTPSTPAPTDESRRPSTFDKIIGQDRAVQRLKILTQASKNSGEQMPHVLLTGPPGLGKTTLAKVIGNELGANVHTIIGSKIRNVEDLVDELSKIEPGDILFIDEIHAVPSRVQEILFPAMEDFVMDRESERLGRNVRVQLPEFTLIGATTNPEGLLSPLRQRFGTVEQMRYYEPSDLAQIAKRSAEKSGIELPDSVALDIARRSRGTPRIANNLMDLTRKVAASQGLSSITPEAASTAFDLWEIDSKGLTADDRKVLSALSSAQGRPIGLNTVASMTGLAINQVRDVVEPFLMREGLLLRTPGGRIVTDAGISHLQNSSFDNDISKSDDSIEIVKADKRKNLVFGWANVAMTADGQVIDHQGHLIDPEDLESSAYNFVVKYRTSGDEHAGEAFGELVESLVVTKDKIEKGGFPPEMLGHWWVGFRLPDEHWEKVERGDRSMFSIQGKARLEPVSES